MEIREDNLLIILPYVRNNKNKIKDSKNQENVTIVKGDMSCFSFEKKHGLVIAPYRAFQALTTMELIRKSLRCIIENLTDEGLFIINVGRINEDISGVLKKEFIVWEQDYKSSHIIKTTQYNSIDTDNKIISITYNFYIMEANGTTDIISDNVSLRYYSLDELKSILEEAGFKIVEEIGSYDGGKITEESDINLVCSKN